jgi:hypothetical protein
MSNGWLPAPLDETNCDADERYTIFRRDYLDAPPDVFAPKPFEVDSRLVDGREVAFLHLTTTGSASRTHDPYRCGRIHWGRPVVQAVYTTHVTAWRKRQSGENRIKIALRSFEYLVVLAEDGKRVRLVTAFYVHDMNQRRKLQRERARS